MRVFALVLLFVMACSTVYALPINDFNEMINGDFGTGTFEGWQHGCDIVIAEDGPGYGPAATCKTPGGDLWLRQIVDNTRGPEWDWNLNVKQVDLMAEIAWQGWAPSESSIKFRLDWWDMSYNDVCNPTELPYFFGAPPADGDQSVGYYVSDWVTYDFANIAPGEWALVNPFNQIYLPMQPRWVSVEVVYDQADGEAVWLDNVVLTARCVPEPSTFVALAAGFGSMVGVGWRRRRS